MKVPKVTNDQLQRLARQLEADPNDQKALAEYLKLRRSAVEETAAAMLEALEKGEGYQMVSAYYLSPEQLERLFRSANELVPELEARDIADTVRQVAYTTINELVGIGRTKS